MLERSKVKEREEVQEKKTGILIWSKRVRLAKVKRAKPRQAFSRSQSLPSSRHDEQLLRTDGAISWRGRESCSSQLRRGEMGVHFFIMTAEQGQRNNIPNLRQ